ncbi:MAG: hypothetical protein ACREUS_08595, partial [Burkholderiales bacterium]
VPISPEDAAKGSVNLKVTSQGCSDKGVCYTPLEQLVRVSLPGSSPVPHMSMPWAIIAASLALGLTLGWAAAGAPLARAQARRMASLELAAWALALTAGGALFAWLGSTIEGRAQSPWIAGSLALAYLVFGALWLRWSLRQGELNWPLRGARDIALLAAVLLFAAYVGDVRIGAAGTLGVGLATGLFLKKQSEAEPQAALQVVALAMLGAAAWVAAPVLPDMLRMLAWAIWLLVAAMLLRAMQSLPADTSAAARLGKALGIGLLLWGVAILIGALSGARDPLQPLAGLVR